MDTGRPLSSRVGRFCLFCAGLFGVFLFVDSLLLFLTLLALLVMGQPLSPYTGILLFLVIPAAGLLGFGMCWFSYQAARTPEPSVRAGRLEPMS